MLVMTMSVLTNTAQSWRGRGARIISNGASVDHQGGIAAATHTTATTKHAQP